jgi:hypothetical protein
MNKKGQSALEFLMTYGWAILVVLAAIGALAYFGVLNPTNFLPDQCLGAVGIGCIGKPDVTSTGIGFIIVNGVGTPITLSQANTVITATTANGTCAGTNVFFCPYGNSTSSCSGLSATVANGAQEMVAVKCTFLGQAAKTSLVFNYQDSQTQFWQNLTLQVSGRVKQ